MTDDLVQDKGSVEVVAKSQRGMLDAVRQALTGAAEAMGGLDCCEATLLPQITRKGTAKEFHIMLSATRRAQVRA